MEIDTTEYYFHYCGADALLSILENKEFWITKLGFMNDASEGSYVHDLASEYLTDHASTLSADQSIKLTSIARRIGRKIWNQNAYILSFSMEGDSLSQWRAYTPLGGYSIGVHKDVVKKYCCENDEVSIVECSYDHRLHKQHVQETICKLLQENNWMDDQEGSSNTESEIRDYIRDVSTKFKHGSFEEEREIRIVVRKGLDSRKVRASNNRIVPFVKMDAAELLCPNESEYPIVIRFSPGQMIGDLREELYWWLLQLGFKKPELLESCSPYVISK